MKSYNIHHARDPSRRPFCVEVDGSHVAVYRQETMHGETGDPSDDYMVMGKRIIDVENARMIWIGDHELATSSSARYFPRGRFPGNSILVQTSEKEYLFIGAVIYRFTTEDHIREFYSPVGPFEVSYPYAIGDALIFFLKEEPTAAWMSREDVDRSMDLYLQREDGRNTSRVLPMVVEHVEEMEENEEKETKEEKTDAHCV